MILVKLGGSVITNKETIEDERSKKIFYRARTARLMGELKSSKEEFILVHGAGSFGHPLSKKFNLGEGYVSAKQIAVAAKVQEDVRTLNLNVISAMREKNLAAVSLPPSLLVKLENGRSKKVNMEQFNHYLKLGAIPVTFGDVVPDISRKFGICSGDDLMLHLAKEFKPRLAIFVTKVDGIYTKDPGDSTGSPPKFITEINEKTIKLITEPRDNVPDVTGRMKRKARMMLTIAKEGVDCVVLNGLKRNRLRRAIKGEKVKCTIARRRK
ncbi:MAG: isopentenyl phosphate kinase family protein [Methanobacteriota archaeon]|nr:MAG: isopentenyl phosphate kinase family protein [Euryarchaeota archaeon]